MKYTVKVSAECAEELKALRAADRARVREAIGGLEQHTDVETKRRKKLDLGRLGIPLPFEYEPPVWQLAVGRWRVFYDVTGDTVTVRAIRHKDPHKTTEEVL